MAGYAGNIFISSFSPSSATKVLLLNFGQNPGNVFLTTTAF
jgi:hypothetical protein